MLSNSSRGTLMSYTDHSVQRRFKSNAPNDWISQRCLVITWPSKRICSSELVPRGSLNWSERINGPCGAIQMSRVVSFRFWRINIISNIFRTFYIVLEENYIAIIIVIELSPSPKHIWNTLKVSSASCGTHMYSWSIHETHSRWAQLHVIHACTAEACTKHTQGELSFMWYTHVQLKHIRNTLKVSSASCDTRMYSWSIHETRSRWAQLLVIHACTAEAYTKHTQGELSFMWYTHIQLKHTRNTLEVSSASCGTRMYSWSIHETHSRWAQLHVVHACTAEACTKHTQGELSFMWYTHVQLKHARNTLKVSSASCGTRMYSWSIYEHDESQGPVAKRLRLVLKVSHLIFLFETGHNVLNWVTLNCRLVC